MRTVELELDDQTLELASAPRGHENVRWVSCSAISWKRCRQIAKPRIPGSECWLTNRSWPILSLSRPWPPVRRNP